MKRDQEINRMTEKAQLRNIQNKKVIITIDVLDFCIRIKEHFDHYTNNLNMQMKWENYYKILLTKFLLRKK